MSGSLPRSIPRHGGVVQDGLPDASGAVGVHPLLQPYLDPDPGPPEGASVPPEAPTSAPRRGTTGHYPEYDRFLKLLADAQRYKLRLNAHKGDLGAVPMDTLTRHLRAEIDELEEAISRGSEIEIILETADVMNFAMGVAISAIRRMNDGETR